MSCSLPRAPAELVCGVGSHAVGSDPLLMLKEIPGLQQVCPREAKPVRTAQ